MNPQTHPFGNCWQLKSLALFHGLAMVLLASWIFPGSHSLWLWMDEKIFFLLNGSLSSGESWQYFWAAMNVRISDVVPMLIILISLTFPILGIKQHQLHSAFIGFVLLIILMWPIREALYELAILLDLSGNSPSIQLQPAYLLSEIFPQLGTKDSSTHSFPGDHSAVLWTWSGFLVLMLRSRLALITVLISVLFMLPRLVAGAHWFTDNFVGGLAVALVTLSWAFHTPLLQKLTTLLCEYLTPFFYRLGKLIPGLNLLPFFRS
ncbi:phosphatase PAP2 family protein [Motiliproteus sp. MSK22-1]|uniref:phosphatase PAP2 family protein n=1 Tax=Motiliproteus sp. MSK22-1 TaxID=1897630 RepID=UPI000975ED69|nr:phosphatase PAP2 family protein [Motiliproteus sp. MSK22-1]OMH38962.1 hypothetical protein BGP75_04345 [Motiliproteus sp. MSK22-1]